MKLVIKIIIKKTKTYIYINMITQLKKLHINFTELLVNVKSVQKESNRVSPVEQSAC